MNDVIADTQIVFQEQWSDRDETSEGGCYRREALEGEVGKVGKESEESEESEESKVGEEGEGKEHTLKCV